MTPSSIRETRSAMKLSLAFGVLMLAGKTAAFLLTGSPAIYSDAAESVVHIFAVGFAGFSLWLSQKPADENHLFGHERISFFSAGFEGALIGLAAVTIIATVVREWQAGLQMRQLSAGAAIVAAAAIINALLGWYLVRTGRRTRSMILEANGVHILTDSWTSFGVVGGLCLVLITGWKPFDPLAAIGVALNILWSGGRLIWRSVSGLMDWADPATGRQLRARMDAVCTEMGIQYHGVRFRSTGHRIVVVVHLLFPQKITLGEAHRRATEVERRLAEGLDFPVEVITHLEALEDHREIHGEGDYAGKPV
jgi:cation diffusion facilitator family transporter